MRSVELGRHLFLPHKAWQLPNWRNLRLPSEPGSNRPSRAHHIQVKRSKFLYNFTCLLSKAGWMAVPGAGCAARPGPPPAFARADPGAFLTCCVLPAASASYCCKTTLREMKNTKKWEKFKLKRSFDNLNMVSWLNTRKWFSQLISRRDINYAQIQECLPTLHQLLQKVFRDREGGSQMIQEWK